MKQLANIVKNPLFLLVVGVIVIAIIAYFAGRSKNGKIKIKPMPKLQLWGAGLSTEESSKIRAYADKLYEDMDCVFCLRDSSIYEDLLIENDTILTGTYNDFNGQYGDLGSGTLTQWLRDEVFTGGTVVTTEALIDRMVALNLS